MNTSMTCSYSAYLSGRIKHVTTGLLLSLVHTRGQCSSLHIIEPPFNIATQSATYTVTACVSRWEPNVLNANNPCPAARQKQYWYFISLLRFSALKCKPNGQKNVVVLENLIIESLHMIETEL